MATLLLEVFAEIFRLSPSASEKTPESAICFMPLSFTIVTSESADATVGALLGGSVTVTVKLSLAWLPSVSCAVRVIVTVPGLRVRIRRSPRSMYAAAMSSSVDEAL